MHPVAMPTLGAEARTALLQRWLMWAAAAALTAPVAVVLHELGHFATAHAFGFPDVVLHYGSVSDSAAENGFPLWQQGVQAAAGPLVTLTIVILCCYAARRAGSKPWSVAPAFAAGIRSVVIGSTYLFIRLRHPSAQGNFDELNAARDLGLPAELVVAVNVLLLLGAWAFLIRGIPKGRRTAALGATATGTIAGLALYFGWLGPWLLP